MKRRSTPQAVVELGAVPRSEMFTFAEAQLPKETGGILVGWYDGGSIIVERAIELPSSDATGTSYVREHRAAAAALAVALADEPSGSPLGYVGEWHSHPAPVGPSPRDFRALLQIASRSGGPVALVVAMRGHHGSWSAWCESRSPSRYRRRRR